MAATSDEEMESLLSVFDQIYEDVKNGISEMQSLQPNNSAELKMRESLGATCNTLRRGMQARGITEKLVDLQQEMTSNWQMETLKQKIMKLRKENEVMKRKFSHSEEGN